MSALAHSRPAPAARVPPERLRRFEPTGLGGGWNVFIDIFMSLPGMRQSEIALTLEREAAAVQGSDDRASLGMRVALLTLRDYVRAGYYPILYGGRPHLAPLLGSTDLDPARRRALLARAYVGARDRALRERGDERWLARLVDALADNPPDAEPLLAALASAPPQVALTRARSTSRPGDARGLWRAVRSTWSMLPEASAPGRELAYLVVDERWPRTPLAILQCRNVVPEIRARDEWLGITVGQARAGGRNGFVGLLQRRGDASQRLSATAARVRTLLEHVALPPDVDRGDPIALGQRARQAHAASHWARRHAPDEADGHLYEAKRAETARELTIGAIGLERAARHEDPVGALTGDADLARSVDLGLRKIWHYFMGFAAFELSICGAAPPFGALRAGKLAGALAASDDVLNDWGEERPLGAIASRVFRPEVRSALPDTGPLVALTSGLYPGHSAQYNRLSVDGRRWRKIGESTGYGNFHIGVDTITAMLSLNEAVDGYRHITRRFGEGANARFRQAGKALESLGLPDLRQHEIRRPIYALPLVDDVQGVLLGWERPRRSPPPTAAALGHQWWSRWVEPDAQRLIASALEADDLSTSVRHVLAAARPSR